MTHNNKAWPEASLQLNPEVNVTITQREGVFLSDVQHVHLYSLFNWNSKVLLKNLVHKGVNFEAQLL